MFVHVSGWWFSTTYMYKKVITTKPTSLSLAFFGIRHQALQASNWFAFMDISNEFTNRIQSNNFSRVLEEMHGTVEWARCIGMCWWPAKVPKKPEDRDIVCFPFCRGHDSGFCWFITTESILILFSAILEMLDSENCAI